MVEPESQNQVAAEAEAEQPTSPGKKTPALLAAVAVVVVVLAVVLVRTFACSTAPAPNVVDVVSKPGSEVVGILRSQHEATIQGYQVYTNSEAFSNVMSQGSGEGSPDMKKYADCYLLMVGDDSGMISAEDVANGADPTRASLMQVVPGDALTAENVADRVAQVAPFDQVYVVAVADDYFSGAAAGGGCVSEFSMSRSDGVWALMVNVYSADEDALGAEKLSSFSLAYESVNPENYLDCYIA